MFYLKVLYPATAVLCTLEWFALEVGLLTYVEFDMRKHEEKRNAQMSGEMEAATMQHDTTQQFLLQVEKQK
jgi:hypothetical protein